MAGCLPAIMASISPWLQCSAVYTPDTAAVCQGDSTKLSVVCLTDSTKLSAVCQSTAPCPGPGLLRPHNTAAPPLPRPRPLHTDTGTTAVPRPRTRRRPRQGTALSRWGESVYITAE